MQLVRQLATGGRALAMIIGMSLCVAGCDKKDDDSDEETEEEEDSDEDSKSQDEGSSDSQATDDPAATDSSTVDPATPTPTTNTPPNKVIVDAGTTAPKDAGTTKKDAGATTKPGAQACLQKCANLLGQCTTSQAKDAGPFAIPNLAKCQAAADSCRKACGG